MKKINKYVSTIFDVASEIFGFHTTLSQARQARKKQVAKFLSELAQIIEDVSASLSKSIYPHGKCQELLTHANALEEAIGDLIGQKKAVSLARQLREVWEIEKLHDELGKKTEAARAKNLHVLDQAAGLFRATAAQVRVSR